MQHMFIQAIREDHHKKKLTSEKTEDSSRSVHAAAEGKAEVPRELLLSSEVKE